MARSRGRPSTLPEPWRSMAEQAGGVGKLAERMGIDPKTIWSYAHEGRIPKSKQKLIEIYKGGIMYKIILKTANETLERLHAGTPQEAARIWAEIRGRAGLEGQTVALIAANSSNQVILRHRFDSEPGVMDYVAPDFDPADLFTAKYAIA